MLDSPADPTARTRPGTPRWVKAFGLIAIGAIMLVVVVRLIGGGQHGPGMHAPSADTGAAVASGPTTSGGIGALAEAAEASRTIEVAALDTLTFEPSRIDVAAGET